MLTESSAPTDFRDAIFESLFLLAQADQNVLLITNDMGALGLKKLRELCPERVINGGVSEQNIMSVAAGLAMGGKRVFVFGIAAHITNRCYEQIKLDICATAQPVVLLAMGGGLSYGSDGPTHHSLQSIAIMRALPNMQVYQPADPCMAAQLVTHAYQKKLPAYIQLDKDSVPNLPVPLHLEVGLRVAKPGRSLALVTTGILLQRALLLAEECGAAVKVIDCFRLSPFPAAALRKELEGCAGVLVLEEHARTGGLASAVAELLAQENLPIRFRSLTLPDIFYLGSASRPWVHEQTGLSEPQLRSTLAQEIRSFS